jgi:anti-sigma factor RsiW
MSEQAQPQITCREFVEMVTDYLEGQIAAVQRHAIEVHLGVCPGCDEYVKQMRLTIGALRGLASDERLEQGTRDEIMRAFAGAHSH